MVPPFINMSPDFMIVAMQCAILEALNLQRCRP